MSSQAEEKKDEVRLRLFISRRMIFVSLSVCLLFPVFFVSLYGLILGIPRILLMAVPFSLFGLTGGWYLLRVWEKKMQRTVGQIVQAKLDSLQGSMTPVPNQSEHYEEEITRLHNELEKTKISYEHQMNLMHSALAKSKGETGQLEQEMEKKLEEMRLAYLEFDDLRKEYRRLEEESAHLLEEEQKKLDHKEALLNEYQRTITEQRVIIEKKQRYIAKLEGKVRDLMYEIRSLLQLEASPSGGSLSENFDSNEQAVFDAFLPPASLANNTTPYDFSTQLQKYVEKAESLTGVDHLGYVGGKSPRFLDPSLECYAVDRRRLFDSFKDETSGAVFIISLVDGKFLFINSAIKILSGWSQEKFIKEFPHLVTQGLREWEEAIFKIKSLREYSLKLAIQCKQGNIKNFDCYLGRISRGPFAQHAIGILTTL